MKISFTGPAMRYMDPNVGYGVASWHIFDEFTKAGFETSIESKDADVEISFADPGNYNFHVRDSYKIAYSAWESTGLRPEYVRRMSRCDEIWGTSPWVESVYRSIFPHKAVFMYKHGINKDWVPKRRYSAGKPFTFLHIGEPYSRKDGQNTVETFIELFGNNPDYRLVLKCSGMNTVKVQHPQYGFLASPSAVYDNIITIENFLSHDQMIDLYSMCDVFLYPSWGEGFGFQPLQALATGMPVISTAEWADYKDYITWPIETTWAASPWPETHQGYMYRPSKHSLKEQMLAAVEEYDDVLESTFKNAFKIHEEYDWTAVTAPAVQRIMEIGKSIGRV